jgi:gamma-glutamyl:cysteine ligase YbdK (ATP-grasp superfamily)
MILEINNKRPLHLFEAFGVEMEYMIVQKESLDVLPVSDKLLERMAGKIVNEVSRHGMAWSNELALHVIEIKTDGPASSLNGLGEIFQQEVQMMVRVLEQFEARLMPGAIHPWMDPYSESVLWPHEYNPIYEAYNRIFNCSGHGWSNLQSTHLNLPFFGDEEFEKLHAAVRIILPLLPAISASSPIADAQKQEFLDFRMEKYRTNSIRIPSITGQIVPEPVFSKQEYEDKILKKMYRDIAPFDQDGILQEEWLNSRGAMSRWDRNAIEIRVIDIQEHPAADIAILEWTTALVLALTEEAWSSTEMQKSWSEQDLYTILMSTVKDGDRSEVKNPPFLSLFGITSEKMSAGNLCAEIADKLHARGSISDESYRILQVIFTHGPLARRILNSLPASFDKKDLFGVYEQLCECLEHGKSFIP